MPLVPGTEGHPPWLQLVGAVTFVIAMAVLAAVSSWRGKQQGEKEAKASADNVARQAGAMVALQPTSARMSDDALLMAIGSLTGAINRLNSLLEEQEQERDAERMADEKILRQQMRELVKAGKLTLTTKE